MQEPVNHWLVTVRNACRKTAPGKESWEDQTSGETRPDIGAARGHPEPVLQFSNYGWLTTRSYRGCTTYTVYCTSDTITSVTI